MVSPSSLPSRASSSRPIVNDQDSSIDAACIEKIEQAPVAASLLDMSETATSHVKEQSEAALTTDFNRSDGKFRRKVPPVKLLERVENAKILESDKGFESQDANFYRDWSSGFRFEVDNKPWSILEWIMQGFKSRLEKE